MRRLPVVGADGKIEGLLSMDDVVDRTELKTSAKGNELTPEDVVSTLKRLYAPPVPETVNHAAAA